MLYHIREGLHQGYPVCCILRYAVERSLNPGGRPAKERGIIEKSPHSNFVPCGLFHKPTRRIK